jgi:uncharacterized protein with GYD domain
MPKYLVNVSYTLEGVKGLRNDGGTKREDVVRKTLEGLGGKLEAFYFTMGERDVLVIADLPDAVAAAALSLSVAAAGGARCSTTPLLTAAEMDHACERKTAYKGPGVALTPLCARTSTESWLARARSLSA